MTIHDILFEQIYRAGLFSKELDACTQNTCLETINGFYWSGMEAYNTVLCIAHGLHDAGLITEQQKPMYSRVIDEAKMHMIGKHSEFQI